MMNTQKCGCPDCTCTIDPERVYNHDGELYCSEACAVQHANGEQCPSPQCHCDRVDKGANRRANEEQLDEALEETFPASDPISP